MIHLNQDTNQEYNHKEDKCYNNYVQYFNGQ
jgi:hypothetical protein